MEKVIYSKGYGSINTYKASIDNAMAIFSNHAQDFSENEIKDNEKIVPIKKLLGAMKEVLLSNEGQELPKMCDFLYGNIKDKQNDIRPKLINSQSLISEVSICLIKNGLTMKDLDTPYLLSDTDILSNLPSFSTFLEGKKAKYFTESEIDTLNDYKVITQGKWKVGADPLRVINFILAFVNNNFVDTNDIEYGLSEYNEMF